MSGEPAPGTVLKRLDEIPDPGGAPADYDALPIIVLRSGDTVRAYVNVCPHAGRPLSLPSGKTLVSEGRYVICPFHGASFELGTGACAGGPAGKSRLKPVAIEVIEGEVRAR
ncbi:(2Fe-2S) ferredoxin [Marinicauda pacifica]|uniref:Rieske (2Fe-2S) protein n=1 Tax=Marinicauda pacifica TaxID=1133559 RepID=A0A4S2HBD5_9PROT|nr:MULTISPECIES: Rieske (2Fe-2S) protein [Marinicauda]TGY93270.1 Rieske (2Fe-2S) protein [Marinicauda pacifica]GGE44274.1 (2Fe-2S) ferredoxin [Marinicauda pacifica]